MKTKLLTTNINVASLTAIDGLTVIPMFPLFLEAHGLRYSVVALVITLWGLWSLKQMDTEQETQREKQTPPVLHKPKHRKNKRRLITAAVTVLMGGVMLVGAIKIIDATQANVNPCLERTQQDCLKQKQQPPCPQRKSSCTLYTAAQTEQLFNKENSHE